MTAILILAAGSSRRLGRPKQLEMFFGETLLERAVRVANQAAIGPVHVVLNAKDGTVVAEARRLGCTVIPNHAAHEGLASSVRAGVKAVRDSAAAVLLMTCDQPAVTPEHLRRLIVDAGSAGVASVYGGTRRGVPAWFPAHVFPELLALRGDVGARELLASALAVELVNGDLDIDTEEDLAYAESIFSPASAK